jgi:hypothetical protein
VIHEVVGDAGPEEGDLLKAVVATVQAPRKSPCLPGGRLTNFTRYIKIDLEGRGVLEGCQQLRRSGCGSVLKVLSMLDR